ncbi:GNAT family N-acetyltransferase [Paenibacillus sp. LMG 31460]|uniref:GNAT family N-acetyltransferase n=1 Tax=Paenibacillus germinis TaxID=2654979 RepID=A0ABX1Z9I4_9BACL|nr:GNAT family N-acetyltransferase [Paenibacillus germinis]NOU88490.1 GNAT family N-acetyltransferase [Paenibacillus germinis]
MNVERMNEVHLGEISTLWNRELGEAFPMRLRLLRQNIAQDRNWLREGSWVALEPGTNRVIGFVIAKIARADAVRAGIPQGLGWLQALLVDSAHRGRGVGRALLLRAEAALREVGATRIQLGNDLHSRIFPGVPEELGEARAWFERQGYAYQDTVHDLLLAYAAEDAVSLPAAPGATFRVAEPADRDALHAFMARCFPGAWAYQHRDYWERGGTGRELVVLERDGAIVGFCRMNDSASPLLAQNIYWTPLFDEELGGIGPLGIDESCRGLKYGISIVQAAIHYLRERGVRRIVIDTTPFVDFYGKLGYRTWKSYAKYAKALE